MNGKSLIIRNCHVIDSNSISDETDVFINNGVIQNITLDDRYDERFCKNQQCTELNAHGMYLLPGLIDCHVHLILDGSKDTVKYVNQSTVDTLKEKAKKNMISSLSNGITTVRDMGGKEFIVSQLKKNIKKGSVQGPRIFSAGHMITSKGGHVKTIARETSKTSQDIKKAVKEQFLNDADFIKLIISGGLLTPDSSPRHTELDRNLVSYAVAEAKKLGLNTAAHVYRNSDIAHAIDAGVCSIEHGTWASERTLKKAAEKNIVLVPTVKAVYDILEHADTLPSYMVRNASQVLNNTKRLISNAKKNKVKIAMGTDAGTPYNHHGDNAKELEYLSEYDLSNWDLIKAATIIPSQLLGIDNHYGKIKRGYTADLLLLNANPLNTISALRNNLRYVIFNGSLYKEP